MSARRDIEATLYRFARGFDEDDFDLLADCMTADAELSSFEGPTSGRDAVLQMLRGRRDAAGADGSQPRHLLANVEIVIESNSTASSRAAYVLFSAGPGGIGVVSTGTYGDRLVRDDGAWRVSHRQVNVDRAGA
jgi:3-phenylpropionate/cinnamic acid dioxygenase small subunit